MQRASGVGSSSLGGEAAETEHPIALISTVETSPLILPCYAGPRATCLGEQKADEPALVALVVGNDGAGPWGFFVLLLAPRPQSAVAETHQLVELTLSAVDPTPCA